MNNRSRRVKYRKSVYGRRRRRTKGAIILSVCAIVLLFVAFIVVGTLLHQKTEKATEPDYGFDPTDSNAEGGLAVTPTVGAYALPLLQDGSSFSSRLAAVSEGASAVCIGLNNSEGTLLFRSEMAQSLPSVGTAPDASNLSDYISSIAGNGLYASGILYVTAFDSSNDLLVDVELSVAGAIACEAIREGVGDVLLAPTVFESDSVEAMCSLADRIHLTESDAVIGILLSEEILNDENRVALISKLSKHFNYMCLNLSAHGENEPIEYIEGRVSEMQLDLMYYKMRVLLPYSSDTAVQEQYVQAVKKYNISSWQMLP